MPLEATDNWLDQAAMRQAFSKAAPRYEAAATFQAAVGAELVQQLEVIRRFQPRRILDLGCGPGNVGRLVAKMYPKAEVVMADIAEGMVVQARSHKRWLAKQRFACADAQLLPFAGRSFDLVISNLALQWCPDLPLALKEIHRVLAGGGLLLATTMGERTLEELRTAAAQADQTLGHNPAPHTSPFIDLHHFGDLVSVSGFRQPVADSDRYPRRFATLRDLMGGLKAIGAHNADRRRRRGLNTRRWLEALESHYPRRDEQGIVATFEVLSVLGWKEEASIGGIPVAGG